MSFSILWLLPNMPLYLKSIFKRNCLSIEPYFSCGTDLQSSFPGMWGLLVLTGKFLVAHGMRDLVPWSSLGSCFGARSLLAAGPLRKFPKCIYFTYPYSFSSVLSFLYVDPFPFLSKRTSSNISCKADQLATNSSVFCCLRELCFSSTFEE